jgi:hypothetical protein
MEVYLHIFLHSVLDTAKWTIFLGKGNQLQIDYEAELIPELILAWWGTK